jgi:hypothetical protein
MTDTSHLAWYKSSYSNGSGGNCIEISTSGDAPLVRDSKDPHGPVLAFSRPAWLHFIAAVQRGELG